MNSTQTTTLLSKPFTPDDIARANEILLQIDLVNKVASWNLGYLALAVGIVLGTGVLTYILSIKPTQEKVDRQEEKIRFLSTELEKKITETNENFSNLVSSQEQGFARVVAETERKVNGLGEELLTKIQDSENKLNEFIRNTDNALKSTKDEYQKFLLKQMWEEHYWWEARGVPANALVSLIDYVEVSLTWEKLPMYELWTARTIDILEKLLAYDHDDKESVHGRLTKILDGLEDSTEKEKLALLISEAFGKK